MTRSEMIIWVSLIVGGLVFQQIWNRWLGKVLRAFYSPPTGRVRLRLTWAIALTVMVMAYPRMSELNVPALVLFLLPLPLAVVATLVYRDQQWPDWAVRIPTRVGPVVRLLALLAAVITGAMAFLFGRDWPRALEVAGLAGSCVAIAWTGRIPKSFRELLVGKPESQLLQKSSNDTNPPSGSA